MSSPKKTKCSNCDKEIDSNKFFLHERFCEINVRKCSICKEPVQKDEYEEHKSVEHAVLFVLFVIKHFQIQNMIPILKIVQKNYMNVNIVDYL